MAIFTLSTSSNYSAIKGSLANGDTIRIDTNAVRLTVDEQPLLTNITVDSPGVSGRMTVSGAYDLATWAIVAGTVTLIDGAFPSGATLGSATASATGGTQHAIASNNGTVLVAIGGGAASARGINFNSGKVGSAVGGSGIQAFGVGTNFATVGNATGGTGSNANGVNTNNSCVTTATAGAGPGAAGVNINNGICLRAFDSGASVAITQLIGGPKLIIGPDYQTATTSYSFVEKIYSIGEVSPLAAIPGTIEIVLLSEGAGAGFTGIRGTHRTLGT